MTDIETACYYEYKDLEELLTNVDEYLEEWGVTSGDIIDFSLSSTFVRNYDIGEKANYTGLLYSAVLLYSIDND